jgi:O-antigen/teichoic acid export membrane protein
MRRAAPAETGTRLRQWGGEALLVATGQVLAALGSLVGVRLLTQTLDPQRYGELALGMAAVAFLQNVLVQPSFEAALRFLAPAREAGQVGPYLAAVRALARRVLLLLASLALLATAILMGLGHERWLGMLAGVVAFTSLSVGSSALNGVQSAARLRAVVAWHEGLGQWLRFLLAALAAVALGRSSSWAMAGYALAAALVLASQASFLRAHASLGPAWREHVTAAALGQWTARLGEYAWPFAAWGVFAGLHAMSGRWALQLFADTRTVARYAVLQQLGYYPVILAWGMVVQLLAPVIFGRAGSGLDAARTVRGRRLCWALIVGTAAVTLAGTAVAAVLHRHVFALAAAPAYRDVSWLLPATVLGAGLFACAQTAAFLFMVEARTRELLPTKISTMLVGTGLNGLGCALFGLEGVVYAGVAYASLYLVVILNASRGRD